MTDDERRSIAAALRAYDGKGADVDTIGEVMAIIIGAGDFEGWSWREVFARLADLIEPPTQCPYYRSDRHYCSAYDDVVNRAALLALADDMQNQQYMRDDARWLRWDEAASRIREACGEAADE